MTIDPTHDHGLPTRLAVVLAAQFGLDIVHAFPVQLFNVQGCPVEHALPDFGRASTLGVVVGNSNALWPAFLQHLASNPAALEAANPLDVFVEVAVTHAVTQCCQAPQRQQQCPSDATMPAEQQDRNGSVRWAIRFSHHTEPGRFVNMMRAAQLSGLAYYSSTTHLCMHPRYGPWFALRAVAVFDVDGPEPSAFTQLPCPHPDLEAQAAEQMRNLEALGGFRNWQQHWREWAALRALGGKYTDARYAYSANQLEYHYTKNKDVLRRALAALQEQQQQQLQEQQQQEQQEQQQQLQEQPRCGDGGSNVTALQM